VIKVKNSTSSTKICKKPCQKKWCLKFQKFSTPVFFEKTGILQGSRRPQTFRNRKKIVKGNKAFLINPYEKKNLWEIIFIDKISESQNAYVVTSFQICK
jgi:hypothetical protein